MKKESPLRVYGIFGFPVRHTLSPAMQEAAFKNLGIKAFYLALELAPPEFRRAMRGLGAAFALQGFNVTVPYKRTVMPYLQGLTAAARAIGAVNTVFRRGGKWWGANTDAEGFSSSLRHDGRLSAKRRNVLVLGAGGAARAVLYACAAQGARSICIVNRHEAKAALLAREYAKLFPRTEFRTLGPASGALKQAVAWAQLVVNATSVGLKPRECALAPAAFPKALGTRKLFFDLIYHPSETAFLKEARRKGHRALGGAGMLLYQGARAFELWTGKKAPVEVMRKALRQALEARES